MKSEISPKLRSFYQEVLKWIDMGCPGSRPFSKNRGLCSTLTEVYPDLFEEQQLLLRKEHGCSGFPFNQESEGDRDFTLEHIYGEMYTNPKRLAFIRKYAGADSENP